MSNAHRRAVFSFGISTIAIAAALSIAQPAAAQTLSTLQGRVDGVAAGTVVTATDATTGQRLTGATKANGSYIIFGLRPSTYHVTVGQRTQDVVVPVGQTVNADFIAPPKSGGGEEIVVRGYRSRQELRTATVNTNVTQAQIENLPQNDRNFLNFAALAPGVTVSPTAGARQIQAGAVSSSQTNVFIDGFSFKNPVNHGGVVGQNFSKGNPFPQLAVQEFAINTQNFKAEFEQAGSAIITAVTKTGGEKFHGDAFIEWQPKDFIRRNYFDRPGKASNKDGTIPKPNYDRKQYGGDLGGPIIKDKLHFFLAFEGTTQELPSNTVNLNAGQTDAVPSSIASQYNGSYAQSFKQRLYFGKLTAFLTSADTVNASGFLRREKNLSDYGGNAVPTHGHNLISNIDTYQLQWSHRAGPFLNEFTGAYNKASNGTPRLTDGPEIVLNRQQRNAGVLQYEQPDGTIGGTITGTPYVTTDNADAFLGASSFYQNDHQRIVTLQDYATYSAGRHVIKGGVKVAFTRLERTEDANSNASYYFLDSSYSSFEASTPIAARVSTVPVAPARAKDTQVGLFIQDDWTPDEHWTINAGIRWDYESNAKDENFVTPPAIAAALRAYQPWTAAGIDPEDYISDGHNRHPVKDAFQPRLGVSYDVRSDRDLVIFAGVGRYYDRPLFIQSGLEQIKDLYQSVPLINFCNPAGGAFTQLTACSAHAGNPGYLPYSTALKDPDSLRSAIISTGLSGDVWLLNNKTRLPYSDEVDFGVRKRLGQINTSVTFSYIRSHNLFMYVRGNRLPNGNYTDAGDQWIDDIFPVSGQLAGHRGKLNIGSNTGKATYAAVYLTAEKPFYANTDWGFTTTLTISRARTNVGQELTADEFFNGPDVDVYGWNRVAGSEKFRFVGTGIVRGPWNTTLSGTLTLASGPSFGSVITGLPNPPPTACCYANFAGLYFPKKTFGYKNLDLRIAKTFKLPWGHSVTLDFQGYNVFDWVNRYYSAWGAGSRSYNAATGQISAPTREENGTVGTARAFQAGVKYSF